MTTDAELQSLAQHILAEAARLTLQRMAATAPTPDPDTLTTIIDVIELPYGSEIRSASGTLFRRTQAGVLRLADAGIYGPAAVSLPAKVTRRAAPKDAVLTTVRELNQAAGETVVRSASGFVYLKSMLYQDKWYRAGFEDLAFSTDIQLPARVLS